MSLRLGAVLLLAACLLLAWYAWRPVHTPPPAAAISRSMPVPDKALWRVVTGRRITRQGAEELQNRLKAAGLDAPMLVRREAVDVYAFDDARSYRSRKAAAAALQMWRSRGFEASLQQSPPGFVVTLGRIYLPEQAEQLRRRLMSAHLPFRLEQRQVVMPVYRLVSPPSTRQAAEERWRQMQELGIADPMLMTEEQFRSVFAQPAGQTE